MSLRNQQIHVSYFPSVYNRTNTQVLHANTQLDQISLFKIDSTVFLLMLRRFFHCLAFWCSLFTMHLYTGVDMIYCACSSMLQHYPGMTGQDLSHTACLRIILLYIT